MELKKSYKGFIIWMLGFCAVCFILPFYPVKDTGVLLRIIDNICTIGIALLAFIIYKTEYVYWYNGTTYEEAVKAGSERRKAFAWQHLKRFGLFALVFLVFSVMMQVMNMTYWIDIIVAVIGLVAVAISTINIKL